MHPHLIHSLSKGLCIALFASGILFPDSAIACEDPPLDQAAANSSVDGIYSGMPGTDVLQRLGTPPNRERRAFRCSFHHIYLYYPQLFVMIQVPHDTWDLDVINAVAQGFVIGFSTQARSSR